MANDSLEIHEAVRDRYGRLALAIQTQESVSCCDAVTSTCCADSIDLYASDTRWLPETVSGLSLGCGDPLALSRLQPGQTVLDLGSGGGIDCFMAARMVGPDGLVIGVDMTPEMIDRANENKNKVGLNNVSFRLGQIESLPVESESVDVIISNCVINLSPDKTAVFREAFRVLKPGGKLAVSDMVTIGQFSAAERADLSAWSECVSGAEDVAAYVTAVRAAGFTEISVREKGRPDTELSMIGDGAGPARLFSAQITAVKPESLREDLFSASNVYFAEVAEEWDTLRSGFFTEEMRDAAIARAQLPLHAVVADIGTGTGFVLQGLLGRAETLVGFDSSPEMLARARLNLDGQDQVTMRLAQGTTLPADDGSFDAVFANMYLHHAPDPAAAIREMARILKPGGKLVITDLDRHDQEWMRAAMADQWLGFERDDVRGWYLDAGLGEIDIDCAEGTCDCSTPSAEAIALGIFVAIARKQ